MAAAAPRRGLLRRHVRDRGPAGAHARLHERLVVTVDATAAGWGWDAMDLHTVLMHELGHVLGLDHAEDGLMGETLRPMISSRCGGKTIRSDRRWTARAPSARLRQLQSSSRC